MKQVLQRPLGLAGLGVAAIVLIGLIIGGIYVFGGNGAKSTTSSGPSCTTALTASAAETVFTIDSSSSKSTFMIHEVLLGQPNIVVGTTNQVSGQILINKQNPTKSQVGQICVDMSTLVTDSDLRNNTIQGRILETGQPGNQFATFTPTSIDGLPSTVTVGTPFSFKITGDLKIHGVTRSTTFDVQVTPVSDTKITGQAQATVKYSDFNIQIPNVPSVSDVGDDVVLALDFTANAS